MPCRQLIVRPAVCHEKLNMRSCLRKAPCCAPSEMPAALNGLYVIVMLFCFVQHSFCKQLGDATYTNIVLEVHMNFLMPCAAWLCTRRGVKDGLELHLHNTLASYISSELTPRHSCRMPTGSLQKAWICQMPHPSHLQRQLLRQLHAHLTCGNASLRLGGQRTPQLPQPPLHRPQAPSSLSLPRRMLPQAGHSQPQHFSCVCSRSASLLARDVAKVCLDPVGRVHTSL